MDDGLVIALASRIRAWYCAEYRKYEETRGRAVRSTYGLKPLPHWDGGTSAFGRRHQAIWPKIAAFCLKYGLDHEVLIRAVFEDLTGSNPPVPTVLMSNTALRLYPGAARRQQNDVVVTYRSQRIEACRRFTIRQLDSEGLTNYQIWRFVIADPLADLSDLFRYCLASSVGALDIAAGYREKAFWQYLRSPQLYDEAMGTVIPHDLREEVARALQEGRR